MRSRGASLMQKWKRTAFLAATRRASEMGKIRLIREIVTDRDWRACAWYLERVFPEEFGRLAERVLPGEKQDNKMSLALVFPLGFDVKRDVFEKFPRRDTYEPAKEVAVDRLS
jgi:hypothetical protein